MEDLQVALISSFPQYIDPLSALCSIRMHMPVFMYVCMYAYLLCTLVFAIIFESKVKLENKSEILLYVMRPKKANLYFSKFLKPDVEIINQNQSNVSNK